MTYTAPMAAADLEVFTVTRNRTWSIMDSGGLEIYTVTGKRRKDALLKFLRAMCPKTWRELRDAAFEWAALNPRPRRSA